MANANYSKIVDCRDTNFNNTLVVAHSQDTFSVSLFQLYVQYLGDSSGAVDAVDVHFLVFGDT